MDFVANFNLENNEIDTDFELQNVEFDAILEVDPAGTSWGSITGTLSNQADLKNALDSKADAGTVEQISETISSYGDIVTHNADEFATAEQGQLADTALQSGDNITELENNAGFITSSALNDYVTDDELSTALEDKQDVINDLSDIRSNATKGASAYSTIQNYGDIVTYNASNFATSTQGSLADTALQPNDNITQLNNNAGYITSASLPTVNNATVKFQKNGTDIKTITLNQSSNETINFPIPTQASDIGAVPTSRTVNSKSLANNISLNSTDVGALSSSTTINDLTTTAQQSALNSNITSTLTSQITTNKNNIEDIQNVIPSAATSSNQLADKNFVNSSIATNTAYFIGTFTSVADLEAYSGTLTNNDYAFVETTDAAGNTLYDRYKYTTATTPASWQFEYELNNSSFTADQWAAVNSGANTTNVGQITTNANDIIRIDSIIGGYGDIVSYNASAFATSVQGGLADTALQPNDNISDLTNDAGYITGITSSDVTTALGYTPYDSSNPSGYTSNVGTVTDVQVDNTSVVTSGVANIDLTGYAETSSLATVATSGSYNDLINTPTIPAAQVNSDWNSSSGVSEILNKPTIPTVNNSTITFTQGGVTKGSFTLNQASGDTIALDAGGGGTIDQTFDKTSANAQSGTAVLDMLETIYPIGSLYMSKNSTNPLASLFGTWQLVASNKALWTGDGTNGGTTIAAGLPNIKGQYAPKSNANNNYSPFSSNSTATGAITAPTMSNSYTANATSGSNYGLKTIGVNASGSSSIYSDSVTTVQPPAYVVNVWERTA